MVFKCEKKNCLKKNIPYNEVVAHRKECFIEETVCIFNCGDGNLYKGKI